MQQRQNIAQSPDTRSVDPFWDLALPLATNLIASIIFALFLQSLLPVGWLPNWAIFAVAIGCAFAFTAWVSKRHPRARIAARVFRALLYREPSASRSGDYFIALAREVFRYAPTPKRAYDELARDVACRRHPCANFLEPVARLIELNSDRPRELRQQILNYVEVLRTQAAASRQSTILSVVHHLTGLNSDTWIVLYGYSSVICDAIAAASALMDRPVIIVEDREYGGPSLGQHELARRRLDKSGVGTIVVPFDQARKLRLRSSNITTTTGESLTLSQNRKLLILLGCEACDPRGNALIPALRAGTTGESKTLIEDLTSGSKPPANETLAETRIVIVAQGYKVYPELNPADHTTCAPRRRNWLFDVAFVIGLWRPPSPTNVRLIPISGPEVSEILAEDGAHVVTGQRIDLSGVMMDWRRRTLTGQMCSTSVEEVRRLVRSCATLLFDLNGVILDDEGLRFRAYARLCEVYGRRLLHHEYLDLCSGRTEDEALRALRSQGKVAQDLTTVSRQLDAFVESEYRTRDRPDVFVEGSPARFVQLQARAGKTCFVVSSLSEADAVMRLSELGLEGVVGPAMRRLGVGESEMHHTFEEIVNQVGGGASKCVLFDDSPQNLEIAKRIGIRTVGVASARRPTEYASEYVIERLGDLLSPDDVEGA